MLENLILYEGRRVWKWKGGRLECSELAQKGVSEKDILGPWTTLEITVGPGDGLAEIQHMTKEKVEHARLCQSVKEK